MKKYIIIIFALILLPMSIGAEIILRKGNKNASAKTQRVQPAHTNNFDAIYAVQPEKKQNISYQNNTYVKPKKQATQGYDVSYFSAGTQVESSSKLHINGNNQGVKYYKYNLPEIAGNNVGSVVNYKITTLQPFNDADMKNVEIGAIQYAYGPPEEGPISDLIFPFLCFVCLYIAVKRRQ